MLREEGVIDINALSFTERSGQCDMTSSEHPTWYPLVRSEGYKVIFTSVEGEWLKVKPYILYYVWLNPALNCPYYWTDHFNLKYIELRIKKIYSLSFLAVFVSVLESFMDFRERPLINHFFSLQKSVSRSAVCRALPATPGHVTKLGNHTN